MAIKSVRVSVGGRWYTVEIEDLSHSPIRVRVEGEIFHVEVEGLPRANVASRKTAPSQSPTPVRPPNVETTRRAPVSSNLICSPMPGRVMAVMVRPGDRVAPGQEVCVVEAMKMEQSIQVSREGVIKAVYVRPLQQVGADDPLVELE